MKNHTKIIFTLSVFLNVLLIGFIGGHVAHMGPPPAPEKMMQRMFKDIAKVLPADKQADFLASVKDVGDDGRNSDEMQKVREESKAILTAPEFDKEKFLATLDKMSDNSVQFRRKMGEAIANAASGLSQDDRKKLAAKLEEMRPRKH